MTTHHPGATLSEPEVTGPGAPGGGPLAALDQPTAYPGSPAPGAGVVIGTRFRTCPPGADPRRVIDAVLVAAGAAPLRLRTPVIAIGSNASPAQLHRKLSAGSERRVLVPLTTEWVPGVAVAHSAHISAAGYVPFAPAAAPGARRFIVGWFDAEQLARMDETEPNYHRIALGAYTIYRGRHGLLRAEPRDHPLPAGPQAAVLAALARHRRIGDLVPALRGGAAAGTAALGADRDLRRALTRRLGAEELVVPDGFATGTAGIDGASTAGTAGTDGAPTAGI